MAGKEALNIWLYGRVLANLVETSRFRYRLTFTEQALDEYGEGSRILSLSLPATSTPQTERSVGNFLDGLLPEGQVRQQVAREAKVSTTDVFGMLKQVGWDCAGAVQVLRPDATPAKGWLHSIDDAELARIVSDMPTYESPDGLGIQSSLAGIQDKLLVTKTPGGWALPHDGAPSTHIIKPRPLTGGPEHLIASEDWALRVATAADLNSSKTELQDFDGRQAIIVERYDREITGERIHQEDFCQALGLAVSDKYEGPTSRTRLQDLIRLASPRADDPTKLRAELLQYVVFNSVIGNGDAHSKNYSILIAKTGQIELAPLYDVAPTYLLNNIYRQTGHSINGKGRLGALKAEDLIAEGVSWGLGRSIAERTVKETVERTVDALNAVIPPLELKDVPKKAIDRMVDRFGARSGDIGVFEAESDRADSQTTGTESAGSIWIKPTTKSDGTHVRGYWQRRPKI